MTTLEQTLASLVAVDTTSFRPNAPLLDVLEPRLLKAGFGCERHAYRDDAGVEKTNLVARFGEAEVAPLALVGHTDCVPYDADWKDALRLTEREGKLYGRGACDTKAFIACALHAAEKLARPGLMLLFTADEEVGCVGAKKLVEQGEARARYAIVGEPTELTPIRAHKGYCLAEVELRGREGHSAYPDVGASAIFHAGRILERLERESLGPLRAASETDREFDPPYTSVNVGVIQGGKAKNIIPGLCRFTVEWRPIPGQPVDQVAKVLEQIVAELKAADPSVDASVRVLRLDRGVATAKDSEVVRFLEKQSGKAAQTVPFGTEAPQLTALGAQAVVFGPGDIKVAHRTGEFVPMAELRRCEEILEQAIATFVGR